MEQGVNGGGPARFTGPEMARLAGFHGAGGG